MAVPQQERINIGGRFFRVREDPLRELSDAEIRKDYRFSRRGCLYIIDLLREDIQHPTRRSRAIDASLMIFIALAYFASGSLLGNIARMHRVSIATTSRAIRRVTLALVKRRNEFIRFPRGSARVAKIQDNFFQIAGFPRVTGAVDCTHVGLHASKLGENEHVYVNRKHRHTINVQLICNPDYTISNVVARWPGSTHDTHILKLSRIGRAFQAGQMEGLLIGDSGYPQREWLMTPMPMDEATEGPNLAYNRAHAATRVLIEQVNGQLKNKFRCLLGQGISMEPRRACDVIVACCVLHNVAKKLREPADEEEDEEHEPDVVEPADDHQAEEEEERLKGRVARQRIICDFFV